MSFLLLFFFWSFLPLTVSHKSSVHFIFNPNWLLLLLKVFSFFFSSYNSHHLFNCSVICTIYFLRCSCVDLYRRRVHAIASPPIPLLLLVFLFLLFIIYFDVKMLFSSCLYPRSLYSHPSLLYVSLFISSIHFEVALINDFCILYFCDFVVWAKIFNGIYHDVSFRFVVNCHWFNKMISEWRGQGVRGIEDTWWFGGALLLVIIYNIICIFYKQFYMLLFVCSSGFMALVAFSIVFVSRNYK